MYMQYGACDTTIIDDDAADYGDAAECDGGTDDDADDADDA